MPRLHRIQNTSANGASAIEALEQRVVPAAAIFDLGSIDGLNGFKVNGATAADGTGVSVSSAGDVNHDGFADFIVGASGADPNGSGSGATYVVFGKAAAFGTNFNLSALDGTNGFKISGELADDNSGSAVSAAGDVNGDGFDDLIVGASGKDVGTENGAGAAYIIYGKRNGFAANLDLSSPTVTKITGGVAGDLVGFSVKAAGDVNGDNFDDLIIGAPGTATFNGASYVVFGKTGGLGTSFLLTALTGSNGFKITGETGEGHAGHSVSGAGDINGDGFDDLIVGAYDIATNGHDYSGAAYVVFGKQAGFAPALALSSLTGTNGFKINAEAADDYAGRSVSGAGDVNGDGLDDLIVGADHTTRNGHIEAGAAYVVFGKRTAFGASLDLSSLTGSNGFKVIGVEDGARLGGAVGAAGDVNGDGFGDILIGADRSKPSTDNSAGSTYVIFGKGTAFTTNVALASLDGTNGFRINGDAAGNHAGFSVSAAGDLNRDGIDDLLVGTPDNDIPTGTGAAYVVFGTPPPIKFSKDFRSATLTDTDGDTITVRVGNTKGKLGPADFEQASGQGLLRLNLSDDGTEFTGASITITAKKARGGTGDGKVNVGAIDATGIDLRNVTVSGDLGQIDAGDTNLLTPGIASLSVGSLGLLANTQPVSVLDSLHSQISGKLGKIKSAGTVKGFVDVNGAIGSVTIGGNLDGTAAGATAGLLQSTGDIGAVSVKLSILGGADASGINSGGKLGRVNVGVDVSSADAANPAHIFAKGKPSPASTRDAVAIASLTVKGKLLNAQILADLDLNNQLNSNAAIGSVSVKGMWTNSHLQATGNVGNVSVGGTFTGDPSHGIVGGIKLGRVNIGGDLLGMSPASQVIICAVGKLGTTKAADALAIAGLTVKGRVENAGILAGYSPTLNAANRDASMGAVSVGGNWTASNLVAGVQDFGQDGFGINDVPIAGNNDAKLIAKIAAVTIKGTVNGSAMVGSHFGITAEQIGSAKIGTTKQALTKGVDDILPSPAPVNTNFRIVEVVTTPV